MPDGPEHETAFRRVTVHLQEDGRLLVCITLDFPAPDPGRTGAVLVYARDVAGRYAPVGPPLFHGLEWARGSLPLADACEAAGP